MTDLCRDLRDLVKGMCPHDDPEQVGTQIREEARRLVNRTWGETVFRWKDYPIVLEDHVDQRAVPFDVESDSGSDKDEDDCGGIERQCRSMRWAIPQIV